MFLLLTLNIFHTFFQCSIVGYELVNISWEVPTHNYTFENAWPIFAKSMTRLIESESAVTICKYIRFLVSKKNK